MASTDLFEPFQMGGLTLPNRMIMAPMTRNRADENGEATPLMATIRTTPATGARRE